MISPLCDLLFWGDFSSYQLFFNYFPNRLLVKAKTKYYRAKELLLINEFLGEGKCNPIKDYLENRKTILIKEQYILDQDSY